MDIFRRRSPRPSHKSKKSDAFRDEGQHNLAKGLFKTSLSLASVVCQALPVSLPKAVFDGVLKVVTELEVAADNAKNEEEMQNHLKALADTLRRPLESVITPTMAPEVTKQIDKLLSELSGISRDCSKSQNRSSLEVFMTRDDVARNMVTQAGRLKNCLEQFQVESSIRIQQKLHVMDKRQEDDRMRDLLRPVHAARHDSKSAATVSACLAGTRTELLKIIQEWVKDDRREKRVFWLNGMAGLGKSTIAKTVATEAEKQQRLGASFFFSKRRNADARLRDANNVIPTLAYQLSKYSPNMHNAMLTSLNDDPDWAEGALPRQVERFVAALSGGPPSSVIPIIVLDALDECDEPGSLQLMQLLISAVIPTKTNTKPIPIKIFITSRPETPIVSLFNRFGKTEQLILHNIEESIVKGDIRHYLEHSLETVADKLFIDIPEKWYSDEDLTKLADRSGKFFIYAATAVRFISDAQANDPPEQLKVLLSSSASENADYSDLDELYLGILTQKGSTKNLKLVVSHFEEVVGSMLYLRDVLSLQDLELLLGKKDSEKGVARKTLSTLHSIVVVPDSDSEAARFYHPSFFDFITNSERCNDSVFQITPIKQEQRLALRCLYTMNTALDFRNDGPKLIPASNGPVPELANRISKHLKYACRHWAFHVAQAPIADPEVTESLNNFASNYLLRWLEVLITLKQISVGIVSMKKAEEWAIQSKCKPETIALFRDAYRFIFAFRYTMNIGTEYIYQAALPFCPRQTTLYKEYQTRSSKVNVIAGSAMQWNSCLGALYTSSPVNCLTFTNDGLLVACGLSDAKICIWEVATGSSKAVLEGHACRVAGIQFSLDGSELVSLSEEGMMRRWDVATGAITFEHQIITNSGYYAYRVAFSSDGSRLAYGTKERVINVCDTSNGDMVYIEGSDNEYPRTAFSPDGVTLAYASGSTVEVCDSVTATGQFVLVGHTEAVQEFAFFPEGGKIVSSASDKTLRIWDMLGGECLKVIPTNSYFSYFSFTVDGKTLAASFDKSIYVWDMNDETTNNFAVLEGHTQAINTIAFSPDGTRLASGATDMFVRMWDMSIPGGNPNIGAHTAPINHLIFSPSAQTFASGSSDGTVRIWEPETGGCLATSESNSSVIRTMSFSEDGTKLATLSNDAMLRIWDIANGMPMAKFEGSTASIDHLALSKDCSLLAASNSDLSVYVYDVLSGTTLAELEGHTTVAKSISFSPEGLVATSSSSETLIWHIETKSCIAVLDFNFASELDTIVSFSADGSVLATVSTTNMRIWEPYSGMLMGEGNDALSKEWTDTNFLLRRPLEPSLFSHVSNNWLSAAWGTDNTTELKTITHIPGEFEPTIRVILVDRMFIGCNNGQILILKIDKDL